MKYIATFIFFLLTINAFANLKQSEVDQLSDFTKIWGIIKYIHPSASRGDFDMNQEFIKKYEQVKNISDKTVFEQNMLDWITYFDVKNAAYQTSRNRSDQAEVYVDYSWIESLINKDLQAKLKTLTENENIGGYYAKIRKIISYVELKDESVDFVFDKENKAHQFLFFASFWNAMQYWNVNITLNDKKWNDVLEETVSLFVQKEKSISFDDIKDKLLARINDSHSDNLDISQVVNRVKYLAPFDGKIVNDSLVVTDLYDYQKSMADGIELGDVIFEIENMTLTEYIDKYFNIAKSNENYVRKRIEKRIILASDKKNLKISVLKTQTGKVEEKTIQLYNNGIDTSQYKTMYTSSRASIQSISDDIGYINLEKVTPSELKYAFKKFKNTKGIIIDLRNYPVNFRDNQLTKYVVTERKQFVKVISPVSPGKRGFIKNNTLNLITGSPFKVRSGRNAYKGIIVLLVDGYTASKAEYIALQIQQNKKCYTIGEQTAGAVMNTNIYKLLNGEDFAFTNYTAIDPVDDYVIQRNGVKIDKIIKESAVSFKPYFYVMEAVKYIENN